MTLKTGTVKALLDLITRQKEPEGERAAIGGFGGVAGPKTQRLLRLNCPK